MVYSDLYVTPRLAPAREDTPSLSERISHWFTHLPIPQGIFIHPRHSTCEIHLPNTFPLEENLCQADETHVTGLFHLALQTSGAGDKNHLAPVNHIFLVKKKHFWDTGIG